MGAIKNKMRSNIRGRWSIFNVSTGVYKYYTFTIICARRNAKWFTTAPSITFVLGLLRYSLLTRLF